MRISRIQAGIEECPEERDEEHDFGRNEKRHAETKPDFGDTVMDFFLNTFENYVLPPEKHDGQNADHAEDNTFEAYREISQFYIMHEKDETKGRKTTRESSR